MLDSSRFSSTTRPTDRVTGMAPSDGVLRVSAIIPARNEAACIGQLATALLALTNARGTPLIQEVVVADNGSSDDTGGIARRAGARVIDVPRPGYGQACWEAVRASSGDVLLFVDGDGAADPADAARLLSAIKSGADMVIGIRGDPDSGSMSFPQRAGNGLACFLMRAIWGMKVSDLGPYRAIRRDAFDALDMRDRGFGWTVEMQVRAHILKLQVQERPVRWHARASGKSKISGTARGVVGAGMGILGMIARLRWRERHRSPSAFFRSYPESTSVVSTDRR